MSSIGIFADCGNLMGGIESPSCVFRIGVCTTSVVYFDSSVINLPLMAINIRTGGLDWLATQLITEGLFNDT